jgi:FtsZ-interacting cell division protein YlmF
LAVHTPPSHRGNPWRLDGSGYVQRKRSWPVQQRRGTTGWAPRVWRLFRYDHHRGRNTTGNQLPSTGSRARTAIADPYFIRPTAAADLVDVGRRLKNGEPVLVDLGAVPPHVKRRMLDACAGLICGLGASVTPTISDRYLLKPSRAMGDPLGRAGLHQTSGRCDPRTGQWSLHRRLVVAALVVINVAALVALILMVAP